MQLALQYRKTFHNWLLRKWYHATSLQKISRSFWPNRCTEFYLMQEDSVREQIFSLRFFHRILTAGIRSCSQRRWKLYPSKSLLFLPTICMLAYWCTYWHACLACYPFKNWKLPSNSNLVGLRDSKEIDNFLSAKRKNMGSHSLNWNIFNLLVCIFWLGFHHHH